MEFTLNSLLQKIPLFIGRTKMQQIYQRVLKELNGVQKYLRCPDLRDKKFEVMRSDIKLDKVYLVCAEIVQEKSTRN